VSVPGNLCALLVEVDTPEGFAAALDEREWDIVFCDWAMPRFSAPAALAMVTEKRAHLPFIVVSGTIGDEAAVAALRAGARDFMTKDKLSRLLPAIDRELREAAMRREKEKIELRYRQSQKMDAIGHFAGGIAHDFNNLLTVILGYVELSLASLADGDPLKRNLGEVREASQRAATLVRQISAFSRQQALHPRVFDLNTVMERMDRLLRRVIGEDVEFVMNLRNGIGPIRADPGQIEQVLMNLVVNARDAMPGGGRLIVETSATGPHVVLSVTDTGTGMDEKTQARLFEPFFTTKEVGKGTGLGLATVYGIVQQSGGTVLVESAPGRGSTFRITFPLAAGVAEAPAEAGQGRTVVGGTETILVVEDNAQIRALAVQVLQKHGYRVLEAASPADAIALTMQEGGTIDLMVTDVIMPGMSGAELAERLSTLRPGMKVLYVSGFAAGAAGRERIPDDGIHFLPKPFTPDALLLRGREILDMPARALSA
jgi:two-component system cell cycle sensor histidine kinase/response regulator CckA